MHVCTGTIKVFQPVLVLLHCLISFCLFITHSNIHLNSFNFSSWTLVVPTYPCCLLHCLLSVVIKMKRETNGVLSELILDCDVEVLTSIISYPSHFLLAYLGIFSLSCEIFILFPPILNVSRIFGTWIRPFIFWQNHYTLQSSTIPEWSKRNFKLLSHLVIQTWPKTECGC